MHRQDCRRHTEAARRRLCYSIRNGALNSHPELNTTLGASGVGITPQRIDVMPQTDIAPFVKTLLGISAAPTASAPARP